MSAKHAILPTDPCERSEALQLYKSMAEGPTDLSEDPKHLAEVWGKAFGQSQQVIQALAELPRNWILYRPWYTSGFPEAPLEVQEWLVEQFCRTNMATMLAQESLLEGTGVMFKHLLPWQLQCMSNSPPRKYSVEEFEFLIRTIYPPSKAYVGYFEGLSEYKNLSTAERLLALRHRTDLVEKWRPYHPSCSEWKFAYLQHSSLN